MNKILNKEVSFDLAKLLKEKGFDENCSDYYTSIGKLNSDGCGDIIFEQGFGSGEPDRMLRFNYSDFNKHQKENCYLCPTIAEVIDWIFEMYNIWISVHPLDNFLKDSKFTASIYETNGLSIKGSFNTPAEAYEDAIKYVL